MKPKILTAVLCVCFLIFSGCAGLQPGYETPVVNITSFEAIPSETVVPRFKIGLHIINPNRTALVLKGVAYTIHLEDRKIMTGVSNELPVIEAYGEGDISLTASVDLFNSIRFFADLLRDGNKKALTYRFDAKLDAGALHPIIKVSQKGTLSLSETGAP